MYGLLKHQSQPLESNGGRRQQLLGPESGSLQKDFHSHLSPSDPAGQRADGAAHGAAGGNLHTHTHISRMNETPPWRKTGATLRATCYMLHATCYMLVAGSLNFHIFMSDRPSTEYLLR